MVVSFQPGEQVLDRVDIALVGDLIEQFGVAFAFTDGSELIGRLVAAKIAPQDTSDTSDRSDGYSSLPDGVYRIVNGKMYLIVEPERNSVSIPKVAPFPNLVWL